MWQVRWLLVWWFAVIAPSGETIFLEYHWKADCVFQRGVYQRVLGLKLTDCVEKHSVDTPNTVG